jgi:hypothetical protein
MPVAHKQPWAPGMAPGHTVLQNKSYELTAERGIETCPGLLEALGPEFYWDWR